MQKSNPKSKAEYDKKINTQMNRDITTPSNGSMPPNTTPPPVSMPMDRGTPPNMGTPTNRGTTPATPINRGTIPGTPINRGILPPTTVPMNGPMQQPINAPTNGATPSAGMPMNNMPMNGMPRNGMPRNSMPMNGMPMNGMPMNGMPMNGMPMNNMPMPNNTPYNAPIGVPLYPLYGYDNCEDLDRDMNYIKQLYPTSARRILNEVNGECDRLEYDGSVMFDEYPDKISLDRIIDRIYEKIKDMEEAPQVKAKSVYYAPRGRQNLLRDFVNIILLNELFNRRRRYRSRRRWF